MTCDFVRGVLSGESPEADVAEHLARCADCRAFQSELDALESLARELPDFPLPPGLAESTLALMDRAIRSPRTRSWATWAAAAAALVAMAPLSWTLLHQPEADTSHMIQKGVGDRLPDVTLKIAVRSQGGVDRLSGVRAYGPDDTVLFRVALDVPAHVVLVRVAADGARVLANQSLAAGETDLAEAWRIETGEPSAVYAVLASPGPLDSDRVVSALSSAYDPDDSQAVCLAAAPLGARCQAAAVSVRP